VVCLFRTHNVSSGWLFLRDSIETRTIDPCGMSTNARQLL
jgi:hypothetical protein